MSVRQLWQQFRDALREAQEERPFRQGYVSNLEGEEEVGWSVFERSVMLEQVNRVRSEYGLNPVSERDVKTREVWASGHADYTRKFARFCAELAVEARGYDCPQ